MPRLNYDPTPTYTDLILSVYNTYARMSTVHVDSSSRARGFNCGVSLHLHHDFDLHMTVCMWVEKALASLCILA